MLTGLHSSLSTCGRRCPTATAVVILVLAPVVIVGLLTSCNCCCSFRDPAAKLPPVDSMFQDVYDEDLKKLLSSAKLLSHDSNANPCDKAYIPESHGSTFLLVYHQDKEEDVRHIQKICSCLKLWDLGVRGLYKGVLR